VHYDEQFYIAWSSKLVLRNEDSMKDQWSFQICSIGSIAFHNIMLLRYQMSVYITYFSFKYFSIISWNFLPIMCRTMRNITGAGRRIGMQNLNTDTFVRSNSKRVASSRCNCISTCDYLYSKKKERESHKL